MARHVIDPNWGTSEQRYAARSKGAKTAKANAAKKREMRELALLILNSELLETDALREELEKRGIPPTGAGAILYAQLAKAARGDTEAAKFIRDTSGQKPVDGLLPGYVDDETPVEDMDLSVLTDAQLRRLAAARRGDDED